jgi:hypothetical protein
MLMLALCSALVAGTSLALSARLAEGSVSQWLIGAYVLGFAEIVAVSLLLSLFSALSRWPLFAVVAGLFCVTLLVGRPAHVPPYRDAARTLIRLLREPAVAVVAAVVACAVVYSVALGLFRPPNDQDALAYHLARAAFWTQQHAIAFIPGAQDIRLDSFAPNGEIALAFTMVTSGSGRYAPLVQLQAALACAVAICGIARRLGFGVPESLLAGLLFPTLPVVAMQMSTGLNDVVVAALVVTTAFFLLRGTRPNLMLGAVSTALLVGTKLTGLLALPGLALVALVARRHRPLVILGAGGLAAAVGAYWYVYAHFAPGGAPGSLSSARGGQGDVVMVLGRSIRLLLDADELPGAAGLDRLFYVFAALIVFGVVCLARRRYRDAAIAGALTVLPLALVPFGQGISRASSKVFFELGRSDAGDLDVHRSVTRASPIFSWYGPLGCMLTLLAIFLVVREVRRGALPAVAAVVAGAPVLWIVLLAIAVPYWEWNGRYVMGGFAVGASTWAVALRIPAVVWASAAIAALTVGLSFVHQHDRPSGLRLLQPTHDRSVWTQPGWRVQATDHADFAAVLRYLDEHVPPQARLAVEPSVYPARGFARGEMLAYAFFGTGLHHHVDLADSAARAHARGDQWAVLRAKHATDCAAGWRTVYRYVNWVVLKRTSSPRCSSSK